MAPRVLFVSGRGSGNTLRYRVRYAEEALRSTGAVTGAVHFSEPGLAAWAREADAVVFYRTPATRRVLSLAAHLRARGVPIGFDVDDLVFLPEHKAWIPFLDDLPPSQRTAFEDAVSSTGRVVPFVDAAAGSTSPVAADLATLTRAPVSVLPNGVPQTAMAIASGVSRGTDPARVRIGYFSGSATHDRDWSVVEPVVADVLRANRQAELWLVGPVAHTPALQGVIDQVRFVDFVPWRRLPELLASVDINIAPLDITPFTEGKSAIKWLEAALVGTPTLATATRPYLDAVVDGQDALLVHDQAQWGELLTGLVGDAALRTSLGEQARQSAVTRFGPGVQEATYRRWLDDLLTHDRAAVDLGEVRRAAGLQPPVRTLGSGLQGYEFPAELQALDLGTPWAARLLAGYRARWRTAVGFARRVVAAVRRRVRSVVGGR